MAMAARSVLEVCDESQVKAPINKSAGGGRYWERGAEARWSGPSNGVSPYTSGSYRASAWSAGWRRAKSHAHRRKPNAARLAHPYRRNSDTLVRLVRRAKAGAVGVSALTMSISVGNSASTSTCEVGHCCCLPSPRAANRRRLRRFHSRASASPLPTAGHSRARRHTVDPALCWLTVKECSVADWQGLGDGGTAELSSFNV